MTNDLMTNDEFMRKLFLTLSCVTLSISATFATGDSLRYLTPKDTIFLQADDFGNKIFTHRMEKGQTLYSLARFYGLKLESLLAFNPSLSRNGQFSLHQPVNIPIPDSALLKVWEKGFPKAGYVPVRYVVKHGDTFYRIAKHMFNIPLDTLKRWNGLDKTILFTGMQLHVGFLSLDGIPDSLQLRNANPFGAKMMQLQMEFDQRSSGGKPKFHSGAAYWQREKEGKTDVYALHRTAPVGSVIQVYNPMKKKTIYAKVIAPIPDRAYGDDIIVVLSPSLAKLLGAKDARFYVEVRYFER